MAPFFLPTATAELTYANQEVPETIVERLRCQKGKAKLDLSVCNIKDVPLEAILVHFGGQPEALDLSFNVLRYISPRFTVEMCQISKLDLSRNEIQRLPDNFGDLRKLTYLDIHRNKLQTLPLGMGNMTQLEYLRVSENPFREPIQNFLGSKCRDVSPVDLADLLVTFLKEKADAHVENVRKSKSIRSKGKGSSKVHHRKRTSKSAKGDHIDQDATTSSSEEESIKDKNKAKLEKKSAVSDASASTVEKSEIIPEPVTRNAMIILILLTICWDVLLFAYFVDKSYLEELANKYPIFVGSIWTVYEPIHSLATTIAATVPKNPDWVFRGTPPVIDFTEPVGFFGKMFATFKSIFRYYLS